MEEDVEARVPKPKFTCGFDFALSCFRSTASPHASKARSVAEVFTAAENSGQKGDKEAQQILAHVSPFPKQSNKQVFTNSEEVSPEYEEAPANATTIALVQVAAQVDPRTPLGNRVGQGFSTAIMSPNRALVTSPLPAKRLYSALCDGTASAAPQTRSTPRRSSAVRRSHNVERNKSGVRKAHGLEETRARKKQKLEGGRLKQIQIVKTAEEKPKITVTVPQEFRFCTDARAKSHGADSITPRTSDKTFQRCLSVHEGRPVSLFVSMAERVQRFQQKTPERFHMLPSGGGSSQLVEFEKPSNPQKLTRPKTPELGTMQRLRSSRAKSSAEFEEEMMAYLPKFKALPLPKRIFKSKGDLGVPRNSKRQMTMPVEFRFQTGQRAQVRCPALPVDEFDELSLSLEQSSEVSQRPTAPKPLRLASEDRGLAEKMRMIQEQIERDQKEAEARIIPKTQPLLYTTKSPIIPPKPAPKVCTKPVPFQLVSLTRHEEEQQQRAAERAQAAEQLDKLLIEVRAQPNLSNAPVFMPVRSNKPLTDIYEFKFNVDSRAVERAEFDKRIWDQISPSPKPSGHSRALIPPPPGRKPFFRPPLGQDQSVLPADCGEFEVSHEDTDESTMDLDDYCSICMDSLSSFRGISRDCGHRFCWDHILPWAKAHASCPLCKRLVVSIDRVSSSHNVCVSSLCGDIGCQPWESSSTSLAYELDPEPSVVSTTSSSAPSSASHCEKCRTTYTYDLVECYLCHTCRHSYCGRWFCSECSGFSPVSPS